MLESKENIVVSIAGFDPSGGAGILADIQTLHQNKVQGMGVVTALTSQDEDKVFGIEWKNFEAIEKQFTPLLTRYDINVFKIGIIRNFKILWQVVNLILDHDINAKIIWDPILKSTSGLYFFEINDDEKFSELLDKLYLITPNKEEFDSLKTLMDMEEIKSNLLLKGGHNEGTDTTDILYLDNGTKINVSGKRFEGKDKHGTGCVLSAAIAAAISKNESLEAACVYGKRYVEGYLISGKDRLGKHYEIKT